MKKNGLTSLFISLFSICLFGQIKNDGGGRKMSYEELKLFYNNSKNNKDKLNFATLYLNKAKKENNNNRIARGYYAFAYNYYFNEPNKAIQYLDSVIKYSKKESDILFPAVAYREKGDFLIKQNKYKEAISNYKLAERYALINNIDYYYIVRDAIAGTKSEKLGEINEALKIYKECFNYYRTKNYRAKKYNSYYLNVIFGLADVFKSLKKVDSCTFFNKLGYNDAKIIKNEEFIALFVLNEGANQTLKKNYTAAIDSINISLPILKKLNNIDNVFASYFYYGKAYEGLDKKELALQNYLKVDSIYQKDNEIMTPEFTEGYRYIINYYKEKNDKVNQLKYLNTYLIIDSTLQKNYKELDKVFQKDYDFPHLVKDKEILIASLENKTRLYYWGISILLLAIIGLVYYQKYTKRIDQQRFEKIIAEAERKNENVLPQEIIVSELITNKELNIAEEIVLKITQKLLQFEKKKGFLNSKLSIQSLSDEFETNSKYLSRVVNELKCKTFVNYVNDLRIEYSINHLQQDSRARKYTLQALANEYGFNTAESFSAAFSKKTGIKPSYFIKVLEKK